MAEELERHPDPIDVAVELEQKATEEALANRQTAPDERPLVVAGETLCCSCEEPIPAGRLAAHPQAARCLECQDAKERGRP